MNRGSLQIMNIFLNVNIIKSKNSYQSINFRIVCQEGFPVSLLVLDKCLEKNKSTKQVIIYDFLPAMRDSFLSLFLTSRSWWKLSENGLSAEVLVAISHFSNSNASKGNRGCLWEINFKFQIHTSLTNKLHFSSERSRLPKIGYYLTCTLPFCRIPTEPDPGTDYH